MRINRMFQCHCLFDFGLSFSNTGCYIIIDLIRRMPKLNLLKAVLLFPTVEHIWDTPNGKTIGNMVVYLRWALVALFHMNYYVSDWVKWRLLQWWFKGRKVSFFVFIHWLVDLFSSFILLFIHSIIHVWREEMGIKAIGGFEWIFISLFKCSAFSLQTSENNLKPLQNQFKRHIKVHQWMSTRRSSLQSF